MCLDSDIVELDGSGLALPQAAHAKWEALAAGGVEHGAVAVAGIAGGGVGAGGDGLVTEELAAVPLDALGARMRMTVRVMRVTVRVLRPTGRVRGSV